MVFLEGGGEAKFEESQLDKMRRQLILVWNARKT